MPLLLRFVILLSLAIGAPLESAEPKLLHVPDPVADALEAAADGRLDEALGALETAVEQSPNDSEAWAALSAVSAEAGGKARAREAASKVLEADPEFGRQTLETSRANFKARKAEVLAAKEKRGEIPLPVAKAKATPDPKVWERLERERRPKATPTPMAEAAPKFSARK